MGDRGTTIAIWLFIAVHSGAVVAILWPSVATKVEASVYGYSAVRICDERTIVYRRHDGSFITNKGDAIADIANACGSCAKATAAALP